MRRKRNIGQGLEPKPEPLAEPERPKNKVNKIGFGSRTLRPHQQDAIQALTYATALSILSSSTPFARTPPPRTRDCPYLSATCDETACNGVTHECQLYRNAMNNLARGRYADAIGGTPNTARMGRPVPTLYSDNYTSNEPDPIPDTIHCPVDSDTPCNDLVCRTNGTCLILDQDPRD